VSLTLGMNTLRLANCACADARDSECSSPILRIKFGFAIVLMALASLCAQAQVGSLPAGAQSAISSALGRNGDSYKVSMHDGYLRAQNTQQRLSAGFQTSGVQVRSGSAHWGMTLEGYGYGDAIKQLRAARPPDLWKCNGPEAMKRPRPGQTGMR